MAVASVTGQVVAASTSGALSHYRRGGVDLHLALYLVLSGILGAFGGVVHGASAAVLGVITAVAILYPYKTVALIFLGSVRLIYLVLGYLALNLLSDNPDFFAAIGARP